MTTYLKRVSYFFSFLGIVFIPFSFNIFPFQKQITDVVFGDLIALVAVNIFGLNQYYHEVSSDSSSMYILVFLLLLLSCFLGLFTMKTGFLKKYYNRIFTFSMTLFCYYLVLQLLNYGVDKVFKSQFYLPEPNILYTPFGKLDKDILFWSTMGVSYGYNVFIGAVQLISAILIFFRKTRVLGLLLALGILSNIIAINVSYDISVKLYTCFLLLLAIVCLIPYLKSLLGVFVWGESAKIDTDKISFSFIEFPALKLYAKLLVLGLILLEVLIPYIKNGHLNDDLVERPYLHGAYELVQVIPIDTADFVKKVPIQRVFVHREGYFIMQDDEDNMLDFKLEIDPLKEQFVLTNYSEKQTKLDYDYSPSDSLLTLQYFYQSKEYQLSLKELDWQSLPVFQDNYHWMIDAQ